MEIPITKLNSSNRVIVNTTDAGESRIEQIKNEIKKCLPSPKFCRVEVYDMWAEE